MGRKMQADIDYKVVFIDRLKQMNINDVFLKIVLEKGRVTKVCQ